MIEEDLMVHKVRDSPISRFQLFFRILKDTTAKKATHPSLSSIVYSPAIFLRILTAYEVARLVFMFYVVVII